MAELGIDLEVISSDGSAAMRLIVPKEIKWQ